MAKSQNAHLIGYSRVLNFWSATALGLSVTFPVFLFGLGRHMLALSGPQAPWDYLLAIFIFLPLLLSRIEATALPNSDGSLYRLAYQNGKAWQAYLVGWISLSGFLLLAAFIALILTDRLSLAAKHLFNFQIAAPLVLLLILALSTFYLVLASRVPFRALTVLTWSSVAVTLLSLCWIQYMSSSSFDALLPEFQPIKHSLAPITFLAMGLWGVDNLIGHQLQCRQPSKTVAFAVVATWAIPCLVAVIAYHIVQENPGLLFENWVTQLSLDEAGGEFVTFLFSVFTLIVALLIALAMANRLALNMARDGFFPLADREDSDSSFRFNVLTSVLVALLIILVSALFSQRTLAALSASHALVASLCALLLHIRLSAKEETNSRWIRLPFHPLLPVLGSTIAFFLLLLTVPGIALESFFLLALGAVFYLAYARKSEKVTKAQGQALSLSYKSTDDCRSVILACFDTQESAASLLKLGAAHAAQKNAQLVLVKVLPLSGDPTARSDRFGASLALRSLQKFVESLDDLDWPVQPVVRIAPDESIGILEAVVEYEPEVILLPWDSKLDITSTSSNLFQLDVFRHTPRPLMILEGNLPESLAAVVVECSDTDHGKLAVLLAASYAKVVGTELVLLSVNRQETSRAEIETALQKIITDSDINPDTATRIVMSDRSAEGIAGETAENELLFLGASLDPVFGHAVPDGLPYDIAMNRRGPTILVKAAESRKSFWARRLGEAVSAAFPTLSVQERAEVFSSMRHQARAGVDFYTLMSLASLIAVLGLLLNSAAVIIGAMLVAPLMSPILSIGHGIVHGNLYMMRRGTASTLKGTAVAIVISAVISLFFETGVPTNEILARTEPNLLDLLVALAAGAAAAYAICRKSVAAALPGVAIAVALVPPLGVVGYGIGSSHFRIAGGALLLFLTNLSSIVLAGAGVFILLGCRPSKSARHDYIRKAIAGGLMSLFILVIPLSFSTHHGFRRTYMKRMVEKIIREQYSERYRLYSLFAERRDGRWLIQPILFSFNPVTISSIEELRTELGEQIGVNVHIEATVIEGKRMVTSQALSGGLHQ